MIKMYQRSKFDLLKEKCRKEGVDLVQTMMHVLSVDKSAIYKRLDGSKILNLEEVIQLQDHFQLPEYFFTSHMSTMIPFRFGNIQHQPETIVGFLTPIHEQLMQLQQMDDVAITYASSEIPLFNYFQYPELTYFKFYIWARTIWEMPHYRNRTFDVSTVLTSEEDRIKVVVDQLREAYSSIPSTEYWSVNILDNTINQIRFYAETDNFTDSRMCSTLMKQLEGLVEQMEETARIGSKPGHAEVQFHLYHNEITHTNNTILVEKGGHPIQTYCSFDNPNFLTTDYSDFCEYTRRWFDKLRKGSTYLSVAGSRQRVKYFRELRRRLEEGK
ncbi:MAG: hypothetical protein K9I85_15695, partial [Saprospiraceae bacterium]|nr:hypothetical protein [Saprospiraceae bacterium]